jgi:hypothetical protein
MLLWHDVHWSGPAFQAIDCPCAPSGLWQATEQVAVDPTRVIVPPAVLVPPGNVTVPKV